MDVYDRHKEGQEFRKYLEEVLYIPPANGKVTDNVCHPISSPLAEKIWQENEGRKRINGHSPEYVAGGFDVPVEELFPSDGLSVYIGDPWQKLDRKSVVIVDYEFGPVAEFQDNKERYLGILDSRLQYIGYGLNYTGGSEVQEFLRRETALARQFYMDACSKPIKEYKKISENFLLMQKRIEEEIERGKGIIKKEKDSHYIGEDALIDLWYTAVHGARAIDVLDWDTQLKDYYEVFAEEIPTSMDDGKREQMLKIKRRQLIEGIRLEKTAKEANVIQAMFPFLPFVDGTFDRFVAFWSISTYAFPSLKENEMMKYWEEIHRVLKPGGKAYIAPIFSGNEWLLYRTLYEFSKNHPDFSYSLDDESDDGEDPNQLVIVKRTNN